MYSLVLYIVELVRGSVGCGVWGVGCGVWGVGCGVWGVGCGVWGGVWGVDIKNSTTPDLLYHYLFIINVPLAKYPHYI